MRRVLFHDGRVYEFLEPAERVLDFLDQEGALAYLERCIHEEEDFRRLRELLARWYSARVLAELSRGEVLEATAREVVRGRLTIIAWPWLEGPIVVGAKVEPTPPPRPRARPQPAEEEEEEPTEETLIVAEDQAEVFEEAAEEGAPVCLA